jgi:hypothetical protein
MTETQSAFASQNAYDTLRTLEEWAAQTPHSTSSPSTQTAGVERNGGKKDKRLSPDISHTKPSVKSADDVPLGAPHNDSILRKRIVGPAIGGLLAVILLGVVWQIFEDIQTRKLIRASLYGLTSSFDATEQEQRSFAGSIPRSPDQTAQTSTAISVRADEVTELKKRLLALVNEISVMRTDFEELATKHEQLSRQIAVMQATEQNLSEKVSSQTQFTASLPQTKAAPPRTAPARSQSRKNVPTIASADPPKPPVATSVPVTIPPNGTASLTERPPRPPLPVPTAAETPSPPN